MRAAEAAAGVLRALRGREPVAEVVALAGAHAGARLLVTRGRVEGSLGRRELDAAAAALGRATLEGGDAGVRELEVAGEVHALFLEVHRGPGRLVIVGAGHLARPLCVVGAMLGFQVTVVDDRPGFATRERFPEAARVLRVDFSDPLRQLDLDEATHLVLVTRGHRYDYEVLRETLRQPVRPAYVGMVGSRRRVRAALEQLAREGIEPGRLREVHAPIGLDIGAETPEEIALAIAAELVLVRRGGSGARLRDRERVADRWVLTAGEGDESPSR